MSSTNLGKGEDFQTLYNSLRDEYTQALLDNEEICKEYESTIELLKDTLKKLNTEKEKLQVKNKEKLLDIQDLSRMNDKLKEDIKKIKEEKKLKETKIVFLENDNEHYQKKIRQFEAIIDDLNSQLESTLEENITLQTEFEVYKQTTSEELMRKDEELQDCKSDIINKEKIIQHLNTKKMMEKIEEKMKMNEYSLQKYQRKYSEKSFEINKKQSIKINSSTSNINTCKNNNNGVLQNRTSVKNHKEDKKEEDYLVTPILNYHGDLPGKFQEIYKKSIKNVLKYSTPGKTETITENKNNNENINDINSNNIHNMEKIVKKTTLFNIDS